MAIPSTNIISLPVYLIIRTAHFTHVLDVGGQPLSLLIVISESDSPHASCIMSSITIWSPEVLPVSADTGAEVGMRPEPGAVTPGVVVTVGNFSNINIRRLKTTF